MLFRPFAKIGMSVSVLALCASTASAINVFPTSDPAGLAGTLFLNLPGLILNDSDIVSGEFGQFGTYFNQQGTYGLPNSGILLSTGNVNDYATGPNNSSDTSTDWGTELFPVEYFPVIASLEQNLLLAPITGGSDHFDPVQLDISFFVNANISQVSFFGTFGSEEFPDYVGEGFNDGFGLFVNGTNVAGVLPTGGVPGDPLVSVSIDHPDMQAIPGTELNGILAPNNNPVLRFDVPVNPGEINRFSILLADTRDSGFDSTVYLSSFFSQGAPTTPDNPPSIATGTTEFDPLLPVGPPDAETGAFLIVLSDVTAGQTIWIDPPVTVGYDYAIVGGVSTTFQSVTAPSLATVPDINGYFLTVGATTISLAAGATIDFLSTFGITPTEFTVSGISEDLMLDPANPLAFPIGVSLLDWAIGADVTITPLVVDTSNPIPPIPLPAGMVLYLGGVGFAGLVLKRRGKQAAA